MGPKERRKTEHANRGDWLATPESPAGNSNLGGSRTGHILHFAMDMDRPAWPLTCWIDLIGIFTTSGTADRLHHPQDVGPLMGTLVQLAGLGFALIAGIATIRKSMG